MSRWIGVALGDITGIGPEVALKALAEEPRSGEERYLLIGDVDYILGLNQQLGLGLELKPYAEGDDSTRFFLFNPVGTALPPNPRVCPSLDRKEGHGMRISRLTQH